MANGVLGDSPLGEFILGLDEVDGPSLMMRAFIATQNIQIRALIHPSTSEVSILMRANIKSVHELMMRARISAAQLLDMRARIRGIVTADLTVTFNAVVVVIEDLLVRYNITGGVRDFRSIAMRALIRQVVGEEVGVTFGVNYTMPVGCTLRPTQRTRVRRGQYLEMRALIDR